MWKGFLGVPSSILEQQQQQSLLTSTNSHEGLWGFCDITRCSRHVGITVITRWQIWAVKKFSISQISQIMTFYKDMSTFYKSESCNYGNPNMMWMHHTFPIHGFLMTTKWLHSFWLNDTNSQLHFLKYFWNNVKDWKIVENKNSGK